MASTIDATKPADGPPANKADLRANWAAAKAEIEALQSATPGGDTIQVQLTDAGTAEGPFIILDRASATPAAGDLLGEVTFRGRDSAANPTDFGRIRGVASEVANGIEASRLQFIVLDGIGNPAESFSVKTDGVIVYKDNNGALPGPSLTIQRHSDDPAGNDKLGLIIWTGRDSAGNETAYASLETAIIDPTNGSEDGELRFSVTKAGGEPKLSAFLNHAGFFHFLEDAGGAGQGPEVAIFRDSTSPTNGDIIGQLLFQGRDNTGGGVDYASIRGQILDVLNGSEDGSLELRVAVAGTLTTMATLSASGIVLLQGVLRTGRGATGARPSASASGSGAMWYDTTLSKPIWSDGSGWRDAAGVSV